MKHLLLAAASLGIASFVLADEPQGPDKQAGYIIGHQIGTNLRRDHLPIDIEDVQRGLRDAMADKPLGISQNDANETMKAFGQRIMAKRKADADERAGKATKFMADFAKEEGVKTTESGLMYKVLTPGKGESPKADSKVRVHYRGTLVDGEEFDSSYKRGEPAEFPVGGVIAGWTEALQLMSPGAKWKLAIPANLAYGERGKGNIGPNENLVFEVELLDIVE